MDDVFFLLRAISITYSIIYIFSLANALRNPMRVSIKMRIKQNSMLTLMRTLIDCFIPAAIGNGHNVHGQAPEFVDSLAAALSRDGRPDSD